MYTKNFESLTKADVLDAGGKGASLGEMTKAGIPVPPGFVVLSSAFEKFLEETDLNVEIDSVLHLVNHNEIHTVEDASEKIKALILDAKMPKDIIDEIEREFKSLDCKYVAVRSSATAEDSSAAAWAGQLESYLNTSSEELLVNVQKCWASLFTPRAIFYRFDKGLHEHKISVAVVVQKMVQSEVSGIAFSVHPVTQDYNQIIIEAGFGLGEAIVSGQITPDSYVIEKSPRRIIDRNIQLQTRGLFKSDNGGNEWRDIPVGQSKKQILQDNNILDLSEIVLRIEKHYGFPCDIEWAFENNKFYIVQSRPITTLAGEAKITKRIFEKYYTRDDGILVFQVWDENQRNVWEKIMGYSAPSYLLNVTDGVAEVYYEPSAFPEMEQKISSKLQEPGYSQSLLDWYSEHLDKIEPIWKSKVGYSTREELLKFFDLSVEGWTGQALTYFIPGMPEGLATKEQREASLKLREKGGTYFEDTDRIMLLSMEKIFPNLGELSRYITLEELKSNNIPSKEELAERKKHFIFFEGQLYSKIDFEQFLNNNDMDIVREEVVYSETIKGEVAMTGKIKGRVKVILKKSLLPEVQQGDILVTAMTTPDFLPAMGRAAAFVTDEGGITCHAAIVAREMKKPCIIGTKIATKLLKDGDMVEVDADTGVVNILNSGLPDPKNYIRMFAGKSFPYLFSNVFLGYYNSLNVVSIQGDNSWMSFFPKSLLEKTQREGNELYTSKENYSRYKEEFEGYKNTSKEYFKSVLGKPVLSDEEVRQFFKHISNLFVYYSKTEFFYTDGINQEKMVISVQEFDELKLGGRAYLNRIFFESDGYIKSLVNKLSKQVNVSASELLNYSVNELAQVVNGVLVEQLEVQKRDTFFESKSIVLFGGDAKPSIDKFFANYLEISDTIKGTIANKGKVTGKARVLVPDAKDFDKISTMVKEMEEGEILIAETTSPDIILACKKAAAIVTNQGGQLSHAAIVSRELDIPCIIGTDKDVILNIKTGDKLEVDANKGIIHIIEKVQRG
jgi:phosphoenolpyruvate synthase/pyruvate phosphate dikinase